ncbi:hypothetical protein SISSUDRAFT_181173 [Sistotremastrum suecicum HHB10207 ss-3]|uniref:Uncharacterized protein n=1 Tax=Sistotremastrum suecicum HHB10207 ss-3 TaxID=1314776 RepID=A0A166GS89_9AGAM|nr:hypothetical protein SISSUDRAFT_181173 [Sistotremastrum suecicum HHB10207 ss-3]
MALTQFEPTVLCSPYVRQLFGDILESADSETWSSSVSDISSDDESELEEFDILLAKLVPLRVVEAHTIHSPIKEVEVPSFDTWRDIVVNEEDDKLWTTKYNINNVDQADRGSLLYSTSPRSPAKLTRGVCPKIQRARRVGIPSCKPRTISLPPTPPPKSTKVPEPIVERLKEPSGTTKPMHVRNASATYAEITKIGKVLTYLVC